VADWDYCGEEEEEEEDESDLWDDVAYGYDDPDFDGKKDSKTEAKLWLEILKSQKKNPQNKK